MNTIEQKQRNERPGNHTPAPETLFTVYAPKRVLSGTRWLYHQTIDGRAFKSITGPIFGETKWQEMELSQIFPDAFAWARCLHAPLENRFMFTHCPPANEVYSSLCNVVMHTENNSPELARICLEGVIADCQQWLQLLKAEKQGEA